MNCLVIKFVITYFLYSNGTSFCQYKQLIVNGIFAPSYWSMEVIKIDLVMLIRLSNCI